MNGKNEKDGNNRKKQAFVGITREQSEGSPALLLNLNKYCMQIVIYTHSTLAQ